MLSFKNTGTGLAVHREGRRVQCWRHLAFAFLGLFCSSGLSFSGPECGFEALTSLLGEGVNLESKSFSSSSFCFHSLLCSVLLNSLKMKTLFVNYLRM